MPINPIKYSNTMIYKIVCKDLNIKDCYVGHTTNFKTRKNHHKSRCNNSSDISYNFYVYQFIRDNGGWINWDMVLIETFNCNNKLEALKKEREFIDSLNATLNKVLPTRTKEEWFYNNIDNKKLYDKEYYINNIDKKEKHRVEYRINNLDKIKELANKKITCECGLCYTNSNKARHLKSKKHLLFINQ